MCLCQHMMMSMMMTSSLVSFGHTPTGRGNREPHELMLSLMKLMELFPVGTQRPELQSDEMIVAVSNMCVCCVNVYRPDKTRPCVCMGAL